MRIQWSRLIGVLFFVFLVMEIGLAFERKILLKRQIESRLQSAKAEVAFLQKENCKLKKEKEALYHPEKIEQLAREKLGLTKPQEIAVKIIKNDSQHEPAAQGKAVSPPRGVWEKMKEEFPVKWLLKLGRS